MPKLKPMYRLFDSLNSKNGRSAKEAASSLHLHAEQQISDIGQEPQMLIIYRGYQLVPVRSNESWQAKPFSGGKLIATTMLFATEDLAMAEARKDVDGFRSAR